MRAATVQQWKFRKLLPPAECTVNALDAWSVDAIWRWAEKTGRLPVFGPTGEAAALVERATPEAASEGAQSA
ncbi:MAG TPA: hypothetical protein VMZ33_06940 [Candidatus Limnocylindrales bacterium]|nr:hypothetical protein [Candidatus Limnocylindrales bacterium]